MNLQLYKNVTAQLKENLTEDRYNHSLGVAFTAAALAMRYYPYEVDRTQLAGLLHDCAKCMPIEKQLAILEDNAVYLTQTELDNPKLLHAKTGKFVATEDYWVYDPEIHDAIWTHTTGAPNMAIMQKIIYVADFIEPNRDDIIPHVEIFRQTAFTDIDKAIYMIAENTLEFLEKKGVPVDPSTQAVYDFYKNEVESRQEA